jgi:myo-inositol-1(or 4)-monophosphatase
MALQTAIAIAREAGGLLREGFAGRRTVEYKSAANLVTDMDLASEALIVSRLRQHFSDHAILTEEAGGDAGAREARRCWVVDPLDGTNNYAHRYPVWSVSIALLEDGEPALGVVYDPLRDECFSAERGGGAFLNGVRLQVSETAALGEALLSTGFPYDRFSSPETNIPELGRVLMRCQGIRRSGSAALDLAYVAAGRSDGHWELGLKPWDVAAGLLLIAEAGGRLSDWEGRATSVWQSRQVATNGQIHAELIEVLASS